MRKHILALFLLVWILLVKFLKQYEFFDTVPSVRLEIKLVCSFSMFWYITI